MKNFKFSRMFEKPGSLIGLTAEIEVTPEIAGEYERPA